MPDHHRIAVALPKAAENDHAGRDWADRRPFLRGDIDPLVVPDHAVDGIMTQSERRRDAARDREAAIGFRFHLYRSIMAAFSRFRRWGDIADGWSRLFHPGARCP